MKTNSLFGVASILLCSASCGMTWQAGAFQFEVISNSPTSVRLNAVATDGEQIVAVGASSTVVRSISSGGILGWETRSVPRDDLNLRAVTRGPDGFSTAGSTNLLFFSSDGAGWDFKARVFGNGVSEDIRGIAALPSGRHVAVPELAVIRYADGNLATWTQATLQSFQLFDRFRAVAARGNNGFVTVGLGGAVRLSTNGGTNWTSSRSLSLSEPALNGVAVGNERIVAVGDSGAVRVLVDGTTEWRTSSLGSVNLNAVAFTGTNFIAVGNAGSVWASEDGETWTSMTNAFSNPMSRDLFGITVATNGPLAGLVVIVGDQGTIILGGQPVEITESGQPQSAVRCEDDGEDMTFSVEAVGTGLSYRWQKEMEGEDGGLVYEDLPGGTNANYNISAPFRTDMAGNYQVVVTGLVGDPRTSTVATLTVNEAVRITQEPQSAEVCENAGPVTFSVQATGAGLTYQWQHNGQNLDGATNSNYELAAPIKVEAAGGYSVRITGICSITNSAVASLTVNGLVRITQEPQSAEVCENAGPVTFIVQATGAGLTYQWQHNGQNLPGATNANYELLAPISLTAAGDYSVWITGICSSTNSAVATLTVNEAVRITAGTSSEQVGEGDEVTFSVAAEGSEVTYQWQMDGTDIEGATGSSYTIDSVKLSDEGNYTVVVKGACYDEVTSSAILTVRPRLIIDWHPPNNVILKWRGDFNLESAEELTAKVWSPVNRTPDENGGWSATVPVSEVFQYFRLNGDR